MSANSARRPESPPGTGAARETVLQFGAGNFLRAFADLLIQQASDAGQSGSGKPRRTEPGCILGSDGVAPTQSRTPMPAQASTPPRRGEANESRLRSGTLLRPLWTTSDQDTGSVVVVQSTPGDRAERLNAQHGSYHVLVRGYRQGQLVDAVERVECISRALVAADDWEAVLRAARAPELRHIVCNTTEAGYQLSDGDTPDDRPPHAFPARLLALLRERHRAGLPGVSVLPCELLENNGDQLKELVLEQHRRWRLPDSLRVWLDEACAFHNTLVDRIVSGMPAEHPLKETDRLLTVADPFVLWIVEARPNQQPFIEHPSIRYVADAGPFQVRKIRILNGAHTALVQKALPMGVPTVRQAVQDERIRPWLEALLFEEIVPTLAGRVEEPEWFARTALERFSNPFVEHRLRDIGLYHATKIGIRLTPTRDEFIDRFGKRPPLLDELLAEDPVQV